MTRTGDFRFANGPSRALGRCALLASLACLLGGAAALAQEPAGPVLAVACAPTEEDTGLVLAGGALHLTRDGGATWIHRIVSGTVSDDKDDSLQEIEDLEPDWEDVAYYDDGDGYYEDPEWMVDYEEEDPEEGEAATPVAAAVADDGRFALLDGENIWLGDHRAAGSRQAGPVAKVRGMRFDAAGILWVAAEGRLLRVDPQGALREIPLLVAGAPARGPGGGVLVPAHDGVFLAGGSAADAQVTQLVSLLVAGARAVAWSPDRPSWLLVASRGRMAWIDLDDGSARDAGGIFGDADRLLRDGDTLLMRRADGTWYRRGGSGWRRIDACDIDLDARGRRWVASDRGLSVPAGPSDSAPTLRQARLPTRLHEPVDDVGPPPCEPALVFPIPRLDLFFRIGQSSRRSEWLPDETEQLDRRAGVRWGVKLTGDFGLASRSGCLPRFETWAGRLEQRRRRAQSLGRAHALAANRLAAATTIGDIGRWRLETEKLAELLRLMTGVEVEEMRP